MFPRVTLIALTLAAYASAACTKTYTVKSGDGCDSIAVANQVSSYQIQHLNGDNVCSFLSVGQTLCLADSTYDCQPVHTVTSGETCGGIASSAGISLDKFYANNPQLGSSCSGIYPGLSLCVDPDSTNPSGDCTKTVTIESGDTCDAIAGRNFISTYTIQNINPAGTCSSLVAGQQICVNSPSNKCVSVYLVSGTEGGCTNIATSHGITFARLRELNPNVDADCTNIYPGESLCIASN
ncbi:hypothetical protein V5O48_010333 [Marasmius crinis-equi]|uniref:LysM domain-containing protein n=1 Tax=Marasmius crinis-equi TaxID=585013 RepID=A0ABR3F8Q8_9AGAR